MFDADKIIRVLQTEMPRAIDAIKVETSETISDIKNNQDTRNTAVAAAAVGALGALFLSKTTGKFGKNLAKLGGLAALGTLAYQAWQKQNANTPQSAFLPDDTNQKSTIGKANIRAIINAMKADGIIDDVEKAKLFEALRNANLSDDEKAFVFDELSKPIDTDAVVNSATSPEIALGIYAASMVAINPNGNSEKTYLADLAARLNISEQIKQNLLDEIKS